MTAVQLQTDSLLALTSGMGDPTRDKAAGTYYGPSFLTALSEAHGLAPDPQP